MTPDPVEIVAHAINAPAGIAASEALARNALTALRDEGLEIVRFGVGYHEPCIPLYASQCREGAVVIERWPGDDSHKAVQS